MSALELVTNWPVDHVAAATVSSAGVATTGEVDHPFHLASLTKPIVAWAILVAVEEGVIDLDRPLRHVTAADGATMRHLLAHAAGFGFDGAVPIAPIAQRRTYSNTGFERAADELTGESGIPIATYVHEAVLAPLGMTSSQLHGSPAHGMWAPLGDVARFVAEMRRPTLIAPATWSDATQTQYAELAGIVPGVGRFDPCPWGLGVEIKGGKQPHWMGAATSATSFGHFGGAGTMMLVDPVADVGVVALTDRAFDEWSADAIDCWAQFSDVAVTELGKDVG